MSEVRAELGGAAYQALLHQWVRMDITQLGTFWTHKNNTYAVRASVYHDLDRAPSYTTHDILLNGLSRAAANQMIKDIQKGRELYLKGDTT